MRMNEYTNLEEFIYEYESGRSIPSDNLDRQKFMVPPEPPEGLWDSAYSRRRASMGFRREALTAGGIEFRYKDVYYRMCREPQDEKNVIILPDGRTGQYDVVILHCEKTGYPMSESFELIGWYSDLEDVLDNCVIQGRKFRDVIMDDETEILGKD